MGHPMEDVMPALLQLIATEPDENGARIGTAPGLEKVRVYDGPTLEDIEAPDVLALGLAIEDVASARGSEQRGYGGRREVTFDIAAIAQSWNGAVDLAPLRASALAVVEAVGAQLDANRDLGGACDWARISRWSYRSVQTAEGAIAVIDFAIRVDATRFEGE